MRRVRGQSEFSTFNSTELDTDELARKIAKAIGAEFRAALRDELKNLQLSSPVTSYTHNTQSEGITMDERIIPMAVKTNADLSNLENMATEEMSIDKDLKKSKSKLKDLLKKKKES